MDAQNLLETLERNRRRPPIDIKRHELIPQRNAWLKEMELDAVQEKQVSAPQFVRKIIPTFYTWDEYRIFLLIWRADVTYEQIVDSVIHQAPISTGNVNIMIMIEATDVIEPFTRRHLDIMKRFSIFLICVPELYVLRIQRANYSDILVSSSPLNTVADLKRAIHDQKGYPVERMDLVFQGQCMNNKQRLFYYDVHDNSTVEMVLQTGLNLRVKVTSFWEHSYDLQIDATSTAREILNLVIRQAVSPYCGKYYIAENFIYPDFLSLDSPQQYHFGQDECVYRVLAEESILHLVVNAKRNTRPVILKVHNCPEVRFLIKTFTT